MGEPLLSWILARIERDWAVIRRAWLTFSLALGFGVALVSVGIWFVMGWRYEGVISVLRAENDFLKQRLQSASEKAKEVEEALAAARRQAATAEAQVADLPRQPPPWLILKREEFIRALREAGPVTLHMNYIDGDRDAARLFSDLHDLLLAGGWTVKEKMSVSGDAWIGVRVLVKNLKAVPPGAALIVELLRQNGIAAGLVEHPTHVVLTSDVFSLDIGFHIGFQP